MDTNSVQTSSSGGVAIFGNILQGLQFLRLSENDGDFVPVIAGTHTVAIREENGVKYLGLSSTFTDGSTVSYDSGSTVGATATFFRYSFRFNMSGTYSDLGTGTLLSAYLTPPPEEWTIGQSAFIFRDVPGASGNFSSTGIQGTVPEPAISMSYMFGIGCWLLSRKRKA
ncbi:hypothetical protein JIN84_19635 [Luteolibacter yonseiensis]|uniref:Uncharacterized protein n=1 Tax=Luteolibacter yonseiensis TaxID=1144680 RepID=A0A934R6F2_9BACT|nr:hypothetical protein [Luteolibacter yonseiensis]MBK1817842.1 hypothetical protein [Luteolibacter yonseiensis]